MRALNLAVIGAALLLSGAGAAAKDKGQPEQVKEKKICKGESSSFSRLSKKVCKTKAEWDATSGQNNVEADEARLRLMSRTD